MADHARPSRMTLRGTIADGSSRLASRLAEFRTASGFAAGITALGAVAGALLIVSEFTTVASVDVAHGSCHVITESDPQLADRCTLSGFERHGGAFLLLGLLALPMAWGAGIGGARAAAGALFAVGAVVLVFGLAADLPEASKTGAIGPLYQGAEGNAGAGLFIELAGGLLAAGAGGWALWRGRRPDG